MDCKLDDVVDVKPIKVRKVRTLKPQPVDISLVNPVISEPLKLPIYTCNDFTINFDD